jgi:hypothetical protein
VKLKFWRGKHALTFRLHVRGHIFGLNVQSRFPHVWLHYWPPCTCEGCAHD